MAHGRTIYLVRKFVKSSPTMPRAHWHDVVSTYDYQKACTIAEGLADNDPECLRAGVFVNGVEKV
jgi:hypothetical protein